ncbi:fumarylacetoacetase [candidate division KSB1 bacterium]
MIKANNPEMKSWLEVDSLSDFPIQNIPFGIISSEKHKPRAATRIGDYVIDLYVLAENGYFDDLGFDARTVFGQSFLNDFIALGKPVWRSLRERISDIFNDEDNDIVIKERLIRKILLDIDTVQMHLPVKVGDYTDFYSSIEHATNVGTMFRDPENALLPNWKHIPIGYHGRSSSIVISGTDIHRPKGQVKDKDKELPEFGPTKLLDFELEMAFITGKQTQLGTSIRTAEAKDHIFGFVLFNDLSARDIQTWEYVPLGPFLSKSFGSVISPWIITLDALEPFKVKGPVQDPKVLPYLEFEGNKNFDIQLEVFLQPKEGEPSRICVSNFKYLYWNICQQLAHQTISGCNINVGDMYASGTISGPTPDSYGSMLELSWRGSKPITLSDGSTRKFINDFDAIIMKGFAEKDGLRIGFGESRTTILPAI